MKRIGMVGALLSVALIAAGQDTEPGQVELPLQVYNQLVDASRDPKRVPKPVPAAYAIGSAEVNVSVGASSPKATAQVSVQVKVRVFENEWSSVPVLPSGTPVQSAQVNGAQIELVSSPYGLIWGVDKAGSYTLSLRYQVDASRSDAGFSLPVPLPEAAATNLTATLPGAGLDVAVIPAAGVQFQTQGASTRVTATVPTTSGVQISWRTPTTQSHSLSRAQYSGKLVGDAVTWTGELSVEVFADETITLPLLPQSVILRDVSVDDKQAPILIEAGRFVTLVKGRGDHRVEIGFEVPVVKDSGPPHINLVIPQVPVSRFDLSLPGKKELTVTPSTNVVAEAAGGTTRFTTFVPMSSSVSFSWAEAVPEAVKAEVRANAAVYHIVHAEEGVLWVRAMVVYEVTRGETNLLKLEVPAGVQVNRVVSPSGAVADWRLSPAKGDAPRQVSVFLDRKVKGELLVDVSYDRSLTGQEELAVPLLTTVEAQRSRGMIALLSSKELTLKPVDEDGATRVGENQLPAFVRDAVELQVAHTFKYVEPPQRLLVQAVPPERKQGRFDAQVDTLISLEEVAMRGSASIEINVKSGGIMELELGLPRAVNLLSLTGPSVRTHTVEDKDDAQQVAVFFTQQMEGQFRLELGYERILVDAESQVEVPTVTVRGAEVEQGRLAVEALTAVEVQAQVTEQLTELDINELPQQLVLRTTNPILLAFKYVQADPPPNLVLKVTRHQEVPVQEAAIDEARYTTLFTSDGLAVTTAEFVVRNSRKQFLRLKLPEDSTVWSAFVNGKPEKPALGEGEEEQLVLVKIITSTQGFVVRLIYATEGSPISGFGRLRATLPRPDTDIPVTHTRWDVYLPESVRYGEPRSNMDPLISGVVETMAKVSDELTRMQEGVQGIEPLHLSVPTTGVHYAWEKLYANQGQEDPWIALSYVSAASASVGAWLCALATLVVLASGAIAAFGLLKVPRLALIIAASCGALVVAVCVMVLRVSLGLPLLVLVLSGAGVAAWRGWQWWQRHQQSSMTQ